MLSGHTCSPHHRPRKPPHFPSELTLHPRRGCTHINATHSGDSKAVSHGLWRPSAHAVGLGSVCGM